MAPTASPTASPTTAPTRSTFVATLADDTGEKKTSYRFQMVTAANTSGTYSNAMIRAPAPDCHARTSTTRALTSNSTTTRAHAQWHGIVPLAPKLVAAYSCA